MTPPQHQPAADHTTPSTTPQREPASGHVTPLQQSPPPGHVTPPQPATAAAPGHASPLSSTSGHASPLPTDEQTTFFDDDDNVRPEQQQQRPLVEQWRCLAPDCGGGDDGDGFVAPYKQVQHHVLIEHVKTKVRRCVSGLVGAGLCGCIDSSSGACRLKLGACI